MNMEKTRCGWVSTDPLYIRYHDEEWGVPVYEDQKHFEFLTLESAQAGLSWITILRKRENYRKAFAGFDPRRIAKFDEDKIVIFASGWKQKNFFPFIKNRLETIRKSTIFISNRKIEDLPFELDDVEKDTDIE